MGEDIGTFCHDPPEWTKLKVKEYQKKVWGHSLPFLFKILSPVRRGQMSQPSAVRQTTLCMMEEMVIRIETQVAWILKYLQHMLTLSKKDGTYICYETYVCLMKVLKDINFINAKSRRGRSSPGAL